MYKPPIAREQAENLAKELAHKSCDGDYGEEEYRLRLATVAQVHATLAVAHAVDNLVLHLRRQAGYRDA